MLRRFITVRVLLVLSVRDAYNFLLSFFLFLLLQGEKKFKTVLKELALTKEVKCWCLAMHQSRCFLIIPSPKQFLGFCCVVNMIVCSKGFKLKVLKPASGQLKYERISFRNMWLSFIVYSVIFLWVLIDIWIFYYVKKMEPCNSFIHPVWTWEKKSEF